MIRRHLALAALALPALLSTPAVAEELPLSVEEFRLWKDYQDALEDPRVKKMPEKQRLGAIARNFKVSEKKLKEAVEKGDQHGAAMGKRAEQAIRAGLADTDVASRIKEIRVDTGASHVVTYLVWTADRPEAIDREACLLVVRAQKASELTSTFKLEASDAADPGRKLFEGIIAAEAAARMNEARIVDFASTRYLKLFEKVTRAE